MATEAKSVDLSGVIDEIADFLVSTPTLEQLAAYTLSDESDGLISELLQANRTRRLTFDEQTALDEYAGINALLQAVKVRAYIKTGKHPNDAK